MTPVFGLVPPSHCGCTNITISIIPRHIVNIVHKTIRIFLVCERCHGLARPCLGIFDFCSFVDVESNSSVLSPRSLGTLVSNSKVADIIQNKAKYSSSLRDIQNSSCDYSIVNAPMQISHNYLVKYPRIVEYWLNEVYLFYSQSAFGSNIVTQSWSHQPEDRSHIILIKYL